MDTFSLQNILDILSIAYRKHCSMANNKIIDIHDYTVLRYIAKLKDTIIVYVYLSTCFTYNKLNIAV